MPTPPKSPPVSIWLPTTETKATVVEGKVTVWDEMVMERRLIQKPAGFSQNEAEPDDDE